MPVSSGPSPRIGRRRLEYDYVGLSNASFTVPAAFPIVGGDVFTTNDRNIQMVTVGVNYLFNWGAY